MSRPNISRRLLYGIPLILGVTFISFLLMVYFGPDKTYELLGKNPSAEQITEVRHLRPDCHIDDAQPMFPEKGQHFLDVWYD